MWNSRKIFIALLSLTLLSSTSLACTGYNSADLIKTDVVIFDNTQGIGQQACYTVPIDFDVPVSGFQTALSIANINTLRSQNGYDFSVRGGQKDRSRILSISLLINDARSWSKITVSYLVTARNDIYAGQFLTDAFDQFDCSVTGTQELAFNYTVPAIASGFDYQVKIFLSGIEVKDNDFDFSFKRATINSRTGLLQVRATSNAVPHVENLHISYVIYRKNIPFNVGYIPSAFVKNEDYVFVHISSITKSNFDMAALTFDSDRLRCNGRGCQDKCCPTSRCTSLGGFIRGKQCIICGLGQRFDENRQCIAACRDNEDFDFDRKQCRCKPGFSKSFASDTCKWSCGSNQIWDGKCTCRQNHARYGGLCIPCPANSRARDGQCVCEKNYLWHPTRYNCQYFTECPANSSPVLIDNKWACQCNTNYMYNPDKKCCDFLPTCPANSKPGFVNQQLKCICDKDFYWNSNKGCCDYVADCGPNASPAYLGNTWQCVCRDGFYLSGKFCKPIQSCCEGAKFNFNTQQCQCTSPGSYLIDGACRSCGKNEQYDNVRRRFICKKGYNYAGSRCVKQCNDFQDQFDDDCVCKSHCILSNQRCSPCPANSRPTSDKTRCVCNNGFTFDSNGNCVPVLPACPEGMQRASNGECICKDGYMEGGRCRSIPKCPIKSRWVQQKLRCECTVKGEYLIDGSCQSCRNNEAWNGKQCACVTGYFKIQGVCRTCDPNSFYTGKDCECNLGFYGRGRESCKKCHSTCGKCLGPKQDQCTMCSDVSYTLKKIGDCGICSRDSKCPVGLYSDRGQCKQCSSYCSECVSDSVCKTCIPGFEINQMEYENVQYSYCVQICGDGKRFQLDCDDGNKKNGDGCNDSCQIQKGWHCQGGSSIKPSTCVPYTPTRSFISLTGTVHLFGKIVQGVRLSYLPPALTADDCKQCHKILWVRVVNSPIVPGVRVNYLPKSQYQFLTQFDFNGLFAIPVFTISIQINPDFLKYFSEADLAQIQVKAIDPAVLAKHDHEQTLSADDIDPTIIKVNSSQLKELFPDSDK